MAINGLSNSNLNSPSRKNSVRAGKVVGPFFNVATGGTVTDVNNYNGTGRPWRVHTFTGNGTFTVTTSATTFRVFVQGGGGGGGPSGGSAPHGSGGNGGNGSVQFLTIPEGSHSVTIGGGGGGVAYGWETGGTGGTTSLGSIASATGGTGGTHTGVNGTTNGPLTNMANGSSNVQYGSGGGAGTQCNKNCTWSAGSSSGAPAANSGGGGGGERAEGSCCGGAGGAAGIVIIAYQLT